MKVGRAIPSKGPSIYQRSRIHLHPEFCLRLLNRNAGSNGQVGGS